MTTLFIFAHPDDEAFGPAGQIITLTESGEDVHVMSLCNGATPTRPEVAKIRQQAFKESCKLMGATPIICDSTDVQLDEHTAMLDITRVINELKPTVVYTHNASDIHRDHRLVSQVALAACRPTTNCSVREFYMCEESGVSTWGFGEVGEVFNPNVYVDIWGYTDFKKKLIRLYDTEHYEYPDARSIDAMVNLAEYRGNQVGYRYAEAFKLVYKR